MHFCLTIDHGEWRTGNPSTRIDRTLAYARLADLAGFDSLWLNEDPDGWDGFAVLGALAMETRHVRLGTGVTNIYHRNPNLIAASVSTLDQLSNGRAFLGIGRGQPEVYANAFGLDVSRPLDAVEQAIGQLRQWWTPPFAASLEIGSPWSRTVGPLTMPPVYIAAAGPRALGLAGRVADGVLFNELTTPEYIEWAVSRVREAASQSGRDPGDLVFFVNPAVMVTENPLPVLERKKAFMASVHALPGMDRLLMTSEWDVPAIMNEVRRHMRTEEILSRGGLFAEMRQLGNLDAAKAAIPTGLVDNASAIGPLPVVREKLARFIAAGATHVFLDRRGLPEDAESARELLASLQYGQPL
jgi:alkanesulfonate monooxygenase SsuD/methylene tetrahydromethanopterin reductase-like flavin-dependent oxidoreductase (luciferase family)